MRCSNQLFRSKALLVRAAASASRAARATKASMSTFPLSSSPSSPSSPGDLADAARTSTAMTASEIPSLVDAVARSSPAEDVLRLAVVGDVHGTWSEADAVALEALSPDAVLLVGDFGNESASLVDALASDLRRARVPFAAILGNHDAWYSMTRRGRERAAERAAAAAAAAAAAGSGGGGEKDDGSENSNSNAGGGFFIPAASSPGIAKQLRSLGRSHVGYSWRSFFDDEEEHEEEEEENNSKKRSNRRLLPQRLAVVGARPFSMGGPDLSRSLPFYSEMYGVSSFEESAERIAGSLREAAAHLDKSRKEEEEGAEAGRGDGSDRSGGSALVVVAHNGPSGRGSRKHDICGADFLEEGGDWGDPDLEEALRLVESEERYGVVSDDDDDDDEEEETTTTEATTATTFPRSRSRPRSACAVPSLVAFGHMHRSLRHASSPLRQRSAVEVCARSGCVFLNAAAWPRAREVAGGGGGGIVQRRVDGVVVSGSSSSEIGEATLRHAVLVEVDRGVVTSAADAWVTVCPRSSSSDDDEASASTEKDSKKKKKKKGKREETLEATAVELKVLLRTERARGEPEGGRGRAQPLFFRSVWRGWTREFELVASPVPARAPEGWEHYRFREEK